MRPDDVERVQDRLRDEARAGAGEHRLACVEIKLYGVLVLNLCVDACSTAWRCRFLTLGTAASSPRMT